MKAREHALPALFLIYVAGLFGYYAFVPAGLFERDGYFHARYAQLLPERGLSRAFPWTELSTWSDRFCDKEFLYHALMMPFARLSSEAIVGAKLLSLLLSISVLATLHWLLRKNQARWPLYWVLLALSSGGLFIARLTMIRSHVLSMLLQLVGLQLLIERRWRALALLGFVYAWSYTVPLALVMSAGAFVAGRFLGRGGLDLRSLGAAALGVLLGLAIHPYSPLTLETFLTYVDVLRFGLLGVRQSGVELGHEIYPLAPKAFVDIYPLLVVLVPALVLTTLRARRRLTAETSGCVAAGVFWFGMMLASARFAEYAVLFLSVACAFVVRDLLTAKSIETWLPKHSLRVGVGALVLIATLALHGRCLRFYTVYQNLNPAREFRGAAKWMNAHLAPGELVLNLHWDDFPALFYDGTRQHYVWGLDPTYTFRKAPNVTKILEKYAQQQIPFDAAVVRALTGAHFMAMRTYRARVYPGLDGQVPVVYIDALATIYSLDASPDRELPE